MMASQSAAAYHKYINKQYTQAIIKKPVQVPHTIPTCPTLTAVGFHCTMCTKGSSKGRAVTLKLHGHYWHQQIQSQFFHFIRVQQVPTGPGPYPQVVLLQTEPEMFTHQSASHLDLSPPIFSTPHILMHKDDPVVPSLSTDHGATPISSGINHHHGCKPTARLNARLIPHLLACPELSPYHAHINAPLHRTCWVVEQCALHPVHCLVNDTLADTTIKAVKAAVGLG
jgi:hypothetical protein